MISPHGYPPSLCLPPQASGSSPIWSPGPIPDFYNQHEDPRMKGNGNQPPSTLPLTPSALLWQPTQAGYASHYDRPSQPIPQSQPVQPLLLAQSAQSIPRFQRTHPALPGHSTRPSQHSQPLQPHPHLRNVPYYAYQPVAGPTMPAVPYTVPVSHSYAPAYPVSNASHGFSSDSH
ncbi:hypothetical protein BDV26DRAFT_203418 [Aspergillus bertholletiae]|uniref:Uncharacterized protein n=1 Tax=Aspergillus bertholletiae TaxID=1226010 RepID=A0A5N7B7V1_9EURO|nr:hypothetical protein BDV26DRAFT_203418 [Aspergillus bertholletiae]